MTYLELVKRVAQELRVELSAKITSVSPEPPTEYGTGTELITSLSQWVQQAWLEIQEDQENWNFMVQRGRMDLVRGQYTYPIGTIVDAGCKEVIYDRLVPFVAPVDSRYIWINDGSIESSPPQPCYYVIPELFFGSADKFNDRTAGQANRYSIDREGCIVFDTYPDDDDYFIHFEFKALPHMLLLDDDVPRGLPTMFDMVIVYRAMMFYSMGDEADKQYARSEKLYKSWMNKLRLRQLGEYTMPGIR